MSDRPPLGRDEIANMAVRDAREIVGFLDEMDTIEADGTEGGIFLLALGVLALEQQRDELAAKLAERERRRMPPAQRRGNDTHSRVT
jgi:hypothetical protein